MRHITLTINAQPTKRTLRRSFGFHPVQRAALDPALAASAELAGACPATAQAFLRPAS